jgi:hypothetical protein
MKFSVIYQPTSLFSLKDSNFTNSGAKSLLLPSPYSIKMALFNQVITIDGVEVFENANSVELSYIRDANIFYSVKGSFCVNNTFVTIQSMRDGKYRGKPSFREYIYLSNKLELIFDVKNETIKNYLKKYLHKINYFGKRGSFFQFSKYSDNPSESNVSVFNASNISFGIIQEYDDMSPNAKFENINNYDSIKAKRVKKLFVIPVSNVSSSKSFSHYRVNETASISV